jgi:hypothetical protein
LEILLVIGGVGLAVVSALAVAVHVLRWPRQSTGNGGAAGQDDSHTPPTFPDSLGHVEVQAEANLKLNSAVDEFGKGAKNSEETLRKVVERAFAEAEREAQFREGGSLARKETLGLTHQNSYAEAEREAQQQAMDEKNFSLELATQRKGEGELRREDREQTFADTIENTSHEVNREVQIEQEREARPAVEKMGVYQVEGIIHPTISMDDQPPAHRLASHDSRVSEPQPKSDFELPAADNAGAFEVKIVPQGIIHAAREGSDREAYTDTQNASGADKGVEPLASLPEASVSQIVFHVRDVDSTQDLIAPTARIAALADEAVTVPRIPRQYRPTVRTPSSSRRRAALQSPTRRAERDRAAPIEVRLTIEHGGFCQVSLLPRRVDGMPVELEVAGSGRPPGLMALQEDWYQDVILPSLGDLLRAGIEWVGALPGSGRARFTLSGRELYVLASHNSLYGFVSTPRLILGEEHVVLCIENRLKEVQAAIAMTRSPEPVLLNSDNGIPAGWVGLRGVAPTIPVAMSLEGDIFNALRPLPEVEIALEGGIRIDRQTWLSGFPPTIRLRGDTSTTSTLTIDGIEASVDPSGGYAALDWDSLGEHLVWCASGTRTYTIRSGAEDWQPWQAYTWSLGERCGSDTASRPAVCGVLVHPPRTARTGSHPVVVPASNPVLIGASPGEIEICRLRHDLISGLCVGFPCFDPIWAVPVDSFQVNKRIASVLLIGRQQSPVRRDEQSARRRPRQGPIVRGDKAMRFWYTAILTAGSKGLRTEPSTTETKDLWKIYKRYAKTLRKINR